MERGETRNDFQSDIKTKNVDFKTRILDCAKPNP